MSEYKVEKGVPLPGSGQEKPQKYPWREMEVGDSFVGDLGAVRASHKRNHDTEERYISRKLGNGSFRIWKIK